MTNIDQIIDTRHKLDRELKLALSDMTKKDDVKIIRNQILANQRACPHFSKEYNFAWVGNTCPYCGQDHCIRPLEG